MFVRIESQYWRDEDAAESHDAKTGAKLMTFHQRYIVVIFIFFPSSSTTPTAIVVVVLVSRVDGNFVTYTGIAVYIIYYIIIILYIGMYVV